MALMKQPTSYMSQNPQENQYLQGNPAVDTNAQTSWMDQNQTPDTSGWASASGSNGQQTQQPAQPQMSTGLVGNGTALTSITGGNTGIAPNSTPNSTMYNSAGGMYQPGMSGGFLGAGQQQQQNQSQQSNNGFGRYLPEGYDINKPDANSTKYQVGRILSQYPPGPEGLQQAAGELARLGITIVGRDTIRLPDGTTSDVGRAFSDPNAGSRAWQYNWSGPAASGAGNAAAGGINRTMPFGSYMGNNVNQNDQQTLMNQIAFQMAQRNRGNTGITGGMINRNPIFG